MTEALNELAAGLVAAQGEFAAIPKTADNPFFKSKYAPLEAVVEVTQPILTKHGLAVAQFPTVLDGEPALKTILLHSSGQSISDTMLLCAAKRDPQGQGAAITYARRFAYMSVLGLVADADDDGNHATRSKQAERKPTPADKARAKLLELCHKEGLSASLIAERFAKEYGKKITLADADVINGFVQILTEEAAVDKAAG
jgi:hypothetical protein